MTTSDKLTPMLFVSHGTAIHSLDPESSFQVDLREYGAKLAEKYKNSPLSGIVIISPHFAADPIRATSYEGTLETIHDHPSDILSSFSYPAIGSSTLSKRIIELMNEAHIPIQQDSSRRGLDHGAWIALSALFPDPTFVPVVQVSMPTTRMDEDFHVRFGAPFLKLREENVLLVFSGGATHNQDEFRRSLLTAFPGFQGLDDWSENARKARRIACNDARIKDWSRNFDQWLSDVLTKKSGQERIDCLRHWRSESPSPEINHPEPSHFFPLLVLIGASINESERDLGKKIHSSFQHSLSMSSFVIGE